jgi:hypothetical protein
LNIYRRVRIPRREESKRNFCHKKKGPPKKEGEIKDKYTDVRFYVVVACEKGAEKEMVKIWRGSLKYTVKKG